MTHTATRGSRAALALLLLLVLQTLFASRTDAQLDPLWDHYKVYVENPPFVPAIPVPPVVLTDQFTQFTHQVFSLDLFMNPVEKRLLPPINTTFPINDSLTHYSWWNITPQPMSLTVAATNQFGDQTITVFDAQYLLNPAIKNQTGSPPVRNHYKCYNCTGQPVNVPVQMIDQFGTWGATVMLPRFFCNPVQKQVVGTPQVYPILDPNQHYICYEFQPPDPTPYTALGSDQFAHDVPLNLHPSQLICVPTLKQGVTGTKKDTWGRLKLLYR